MIHDQHTGPWAHMAPGLGVRPPAVVCFTLEPKTVGYLLELAIGGARIVRDVSQPPAAFRNVSRAMEPR